MNNMNTKKNLNDMGLTNNAVKYIYHMTGNLEVPEGSYPFQPILELLAVKQLCCQAEVGDYERWKVVISDGNYIMDGMAAGWYTAEIRSGHIGKGTTFIIETFHNKILQINGKQHKICILLDITPAPVRRYREPTTNKH